VYTSTQLATMTSSNFSGTTGTTCSGASWDVTWCPLSRSAQQSAGADYMGVYIVVNHPYVTRMFPGGGITIDDNAVMRLEPST
jgi:hypothetical protein